MVCDTTMCTLEAQIIQLTSRTHYCRSPLASANECPNAGFHKLAVLSQYPLNTASVQYLVIVSSSSLYPNGSR